MLLLRIVAKGKMSCQNKTSLRSLRSNPVSAVYVSCWVMKLLLFDQNLSPSLVNLLGDIYPGSVHVDRMGLPTAPDREVWDYALVSMTILSLPRMRILVN